MHERGNLQGHDQRIPLHMQSRLHWSVLTLMTSCHSLSFPLLTESECVPCESTSNPSVLSNPATVGPNCQTNINECASNPCLNQGTCIDDVAGYKCNCLLPYTGMTHSCLFFTLLTRLFDLVSCLHRSENEKTIFRFPHRRLLSCVVLENISQWPQTGMSVFGISVWKDLLVCFAGITVCVCVLE